MPFDLLIFFQKIAISALPVLLAITVHEASHGYAARALGDRTAEMLGRLSFNPIRHIDLVGTIIVPVALQIMGGFLFGWAKPVPVNTRNLKRPRRDMALVAIVGPFSNGLMAIGWALLLKFVLGQDSDEGLWLILRLMAVVGIGINVALMVLNLLPLPPLDGGRVLTGLLPEPLARKLDRIEPYGMVILLGLMFTGILGKILFWPMALSEFALFSLFQINSSRLY